jgi:hypothetical protein
MKKMNNKKRGLFMRKACMGFICLFFMLSMTTLCFAQSSLMVVRASDDSLWKATCDGDVCGSFTSFPGRFRQQPTITWDESLQKWVIVGVASDNTIWRATFDKLGDFNNDWQNIPGSTASPVGLSGNSSGSLIAYDAGNQKLGNYLGDSYVYIPSLNRQVVIKPADGEIDGCGQLLYESTNCTGTAYAYPYLSYYVFKSRDKIYSGNKVIPALKNIKSYWEDCGSTPSCSQDVNVQDYFVPVSETVLPFNVPVALPLNFVFE